MKYFTVLLCLCGGLIGETLTIDSIIDPGHWLNPSYILVSDDLYGEPHQHNDTITLSLADPVESGVNVDSIFVFVEQHVSDSTNALWRIVPVVQDSLYPPTPQQFGTEYDSLLRFDISSAISSLPDLISLRIKLVPQKIVGNQPNWFADYVYAETFYSPVGIQETAHNCQHEISVSTILKNELYFTCTLGKPAPITITVWNSLGECIARETVQGNEGQNHITMSNTNNLATGVYFLQTLVQGDINTAKLLFVR